MSLNKQSVTKLIVPLAGLGTRFAPSSTAYPKEMTHLVDKPVIQYIVEEAILSGFKEIIFILNSDKTIIQKYFSNKHQKDYIKKAFSDEAKIPEDLHKLHKLLKKIKFRYVKRDSTLGDGHSIFLAKKYIRPGEPFAVSMGDLLGFSEVPYLKQLIDVYKKNKSPVVSVEEVELEATSRFGVIDPKKSKGRLHLIKGIIEKPGPILAPSRFILTGKYILTPEIFGYLGNMVKNYKTGEVKLAEALEKYAKTNDIYAYECIGKIQDTGNKLDFIKASINFGLLNPNYSNDLRKFIKGIQ